MTFGSLLESSRVESGRVETIGPLRAVSPWHDAHLTLSPVTHTATPRAWAPPCHKISDVSPAARRPLFTEMLELPVFRRHFATGVSREREEEENRRATDGFGVLNEHLVPERERRKT